MKPTRDSAIVDSTITGDRVALSIDQAAMQHIMNVLTDLYSDPEYAIIREYSTNAWDAHVEAGHTAPIEVTTPTSLSPYLTIRDHGVGLSVEDVHTIYSRYGASTKRESNEQQGMLGLGCKSALTYAAQFTITAVKDGTKAVVSVGRDEDGGGSMTILDTTSTDEGNGVTVQIPARRGNDLQEKAESFFRFWKPGTVLLNGRQPEHFAAGDDVLRLSDDLYVVEQQGRYDYTRQRYANDSFVVMGNVAYPHDFGDELPRRVGLVAFVPIGSVAFTPSRESLMDTASTRRTLAQVVADYRRLARKAVQHHVDQAPTHADALAVVVKWSQHLAPNDTFKYQGADLPTEYTSSVYGQIEVTPMFQSYGRLGGSSKVRSVQATTWPQSIWVEGWTPQALSAPHKRKLQTWCEDNGLTGIAQAVLLRPGAAKITSPFIPRSHVVDYDTIKAIKLTTVQRAAHATPRIAGSFDVLVKASGGLPTRNEGVPGDDLDTTKPIFWLHGNKWVGGNEASRLALHYDEFTLVCLPANRIEKFKRDVPKAEHYGDALKRAQQAWLDGLTDQQRLALYMELRSERTSLRSLDPDRVDDPDLQTAARAAKVDAAQLAKTFRTYGLSYNSIKLAWENPLTHYPLFDATWVQRSKWKDHTYEYLNHAYKVRQEKEDNV